MKKAEKILFVDNLTKELQDAKSVVLVNYSGLTVAAQQDLKKRLSDVGGRMLVVKNTLLKRAGESAKIDKDILTDTVLTGQTALIIADEDPITPLQALGKFAKEFNIPEFKVGVIEGKFFDSTSLSQISNLPPRDALLGQLLGVLMSPSYELVSTLNGNLQKLVYVLKEVNNRD